MRTEIALVMIGLGLAGCAAGPSPRAASAVDARASATATVAGPCPATDAPLARPDACLYPADVQAFLADRDLCDHFRGEPWPEGDTADDRERRRFLVDAVRRECAGTDRRLEALKSRYADRAEILGVLSAFEVDIGS